MWLCALSSWRRLDSWGVETGEICDNTVARGGSFVSRYDCIMVSWYDCSLSKTLVGSCIASFGLNCCLAGRSVACKAADISTSLINTYWFPGAIAGMVSNMYIWTVFCGHNWFLACVSFDWRGRHWKDYYHFRTHAGCFLSFFSGQTWRRRAIHDFHL